MANPPHTRKLEIRDRIKELRRVRASELIFNSRNWRKHPAVQRQALHAMLVKVGYADALIARELPDGRLQLIDGHLRAETTPDTMVPVLILDVSEEEADQLLLTLDPLAAMAEADSERLRELIESVRVGNEAVQEVLRRTAGEQLWASIFPHDVDDVEVGGDRADELRLKWGTAPGQMWRAGAHSIVCGDCADPATLARLWSGDSNRVRMIATDPPYGVHYADKNRMLNKSDRGNRVQRPILNDDLPADEIEKLFATALSTAIPYCVKAAVIYATVPSGPLTMNFIRALGKSGFALKHILVWLKNQFVIGMADYQHRHELILYGWIENGRHYFVRDRSQDSVFEVDKPHVSGLHSTSKPVELLARMIANSSRPGELVYDPFCGSGSTIVAAHQLGRIGFGCDVDPGYVAVTLERLSLLGLKPEPAK